MARAIPESGSPVPCQLELSMAEPHYFVHGEIIAFAAISVFVFFLLFLIVPCIRRIKTK